MNFAAIVRAVARRARLRGARARRCREADREHARSARQFCHVGHRRSTVCYARATARLAAAWKWGLAVHEIGHLLAGAPGMRRRHTEADAQRAGKRATGIGVSYRGPLRLEWSRPPR